jgi:hypothetical protein
VELADINKRTSLQSFSIFTGVKSFIVVYCDKTLQKEKKGKYILSASSFRLYAVAPNSI